MTELELLKFKLLADGVRIGAGVETSWQERFGGPMTLGEYATTSGIALVLPGQLYVNAPVAHGDERPALRADGAAFVLVDDGEEVPLDVVPIPAFHRSTYEDGGVVYPLTNLGVTHTDRCRVSPVEGCAWKCRFCELPYEFKYRRKDREQLLDLVRIAEHDPLAPARHVLVSGGVPGRKHEDWIDDVYRYLAQESHLPVDVMMPPRRDLGYPAWLRSVGVNSVSINLEVSDPDRAAEITPQKSRLLGRQHFLDYIERAVEHFGVGNVQSLLVFGSAIESLRSTLQGVQDLVDRGCIPVLSMFRPHPLTPLADSPATTLDEMLAVYDATLAICEQSSNGVLPGPRCIPCQHNTVTLPIEGGFYVAADGDLTAPCPTC